MYIYMYTDVHSSSGEPVVEMQAMHFSQMYKLSRHANKGLSCLVSDVQVIYPGLKPNLAFTSEADYA